MATPSPLQKFHEAAEAEMLIVGPANASAGGTLAASGVESQGLSICLVATYQEIEAEYAAIRKSVGVLDLPNRGTLRVTGDDAVDFLNRMLTNDVKVVQTGKVVRAFLLNRQGRILGDLVLSAGGEDAEIFIDLDAFVVVEVQAVLEGFVFGEAIEFEDISLTQHRLALHGPGGLKLLGQVLDGETDAFELAEGENRGVVILGHSVMVVRRDTTGEIGLELTCPVEAVAAIHAELLACGEDAGVRPVGWMAFNMARLEAGTPIFQVDFGTDSLPHETGELLHQAVSFSKGCYPGQEIVARMESRGHPSKILVGLKMVGEQMPTTGTAVFELIGEEGREQGGEIIGAVTSAAPSPMLGNIGIAFAMVKYAQAEPGSKVLVGTADGAIPGTVQSLQFWPVETPSA